MSTVPGESTWVDAGLVPPDPDQVRVEPETAVGAPRPDLDGLATEPDVVEQAIEAGDDDEDAYPEA